MRSDRPRVGSPGLRRPHPAGHVPRPRAATDRGRYRRMSGTAGAAGYVTAEAAAVLPVLVIVLVISLWGITAVADQLRCVDAAREGARLLARGEPAAVAAAAARDVAPGGASVTFGSSGEEVRVRVQAHVGPVGVRWAPRVSVSAEAVARAEPGVPTVAKAPIAQQASRTQHGPCAQPALCAPPAPRAQPAPP